MSWLLGMPLYNRHRHPSDAMRPIAGQLRQCSRGLCHSPEQLPRAISVLRLAVCELSDLVETRSAGSGQPLAEGNQEPPVAPAAGVGTGQGERHSPKVERGGHRSSSPRIRSNVEKEEEESEEKRGERSGSLRRDASPELEKAEKVAKRRRSKSEDDSEQHKERKSKRKDKSPTKSSRERSRRRQRASPEAPGAPTSKSAPVRAPIEAKKEESAEEEGPEEPPGRWTLTPAAAVRPTPSVRAPFARHSKPPEPPGPPPGWGATSSGSTSKRSKGVARKERRPVAAAKAGAVVEPKRARRKPAGEDEREAEVEAGAKAPQAEEFEKFSKGEEVEGVRLAPGVFSRGDILVGVEGRYFGEKASFALQFEKEELESGERELCGVLLGTTSEPLLRFATTHKPCRLQVHLCPRDCSQLRENPNLVHVRRIRKLLPDQPRTWETNLVEDVETGRLQKEAEDLRIQKEEEKKARKRRSSSTSPSVKAKKKKKKKKRREERREEGEASAPEKKVKLGGKTTARKPLEALYQGTGLDPSLKNRRKILKKLKRALRKTKTTSSSTASSVSTTSSEVEAEEILQDRSRIQRIHAIAPGVLAAQGISNMKDHLLQAGGQAWDEDTLQQMPPILCQYYRLHMVPRLSGGVSREFSTLSFIGDLLLQGRASEAMDCLVQRMKSLEMTSSGTSWSTSQKLELVPPPTATIGSRSEYQVAIKEARLDNQVLPPAQAADKGKGKSKDKNREKGKEKGRGKAKESDPKKTPA
eukprot:s3214_g8.t1